MYGSVRSETDIAINTLIHMSHQIAVSSHNVTILFTFIKKLTSERNLSLSCVSIWEIRKICN